jgi:hypothetical protein
MIEVFLKSSIFSLSLSCKILDQKFHLFDFYSSPFQRSGVELNEEQILPLSCCKVLNFNYCLKLKTLPNLQYCNIFQELQNWPDFGKWYIHKIKIFY